MGIVRVAKFQTSDGKLWDREQDAKEHENRAEAVRKMLALLKETMKTGRPEAILHQIVVEETAVRDILLAYHKRLPKQTVELKKAA
jgi:hypothetical protein